jgi:hypothetical protein
MPGKNRYVRGEKSRCGLGESNDFQEILVIEPLPFREFLLDGGNHRDASSNSERTDFAENKKYLPQ